MRTLEQLRERLARYGDAECLYDPAVGYLAWHTTTGDNLEILFIEAAEPRKGHGTELCRWMVQRLVKEGREPYHSVVVYRLGANQTAETFYTSLGFRQVDLGRSIYRDDGTVLMWVTWAELKRNLGL